MAAQTLDALFNPRAIALVGASNRPGSVGAVVARNLLEGRFRGPVMPVNPHEQAIHSTAAYPTLAGLPAAPDLAVIATPAATVPQIVAELGQAGCRAAVIISAGFETACADGPDLRQAVLTAAAAHGLRVLGPNTLGFISPAVGINASFAHLTPKAGGLALIAQSGAIAAAALDWAQPRGIGFSHVISIGDAIDIDVGDLLERLAHDDRTTAILLYVESITDARKFMTAARLAAKTKPVVVVKAGRGALGAKAAFSHTGALAGADAVYDAAFRRAGMLRVEDLRQLFDAVATLSAGLSVSGDRLAILTNGGGAGVLAVDAMEGGPGALAVLSDATVAAISEHTSPNWSHRNPADILGDAAAETYAEALDALEQDDGVDAILAMNCPTAVTDSLEAARAVTYAALPRRKRKPVLTCWLGEMAAGPARALFTSAGLPAHETPREAVRAFTHLVEHRLNQQLAAQAPASAAASPQRFQAGLLVQRAVEDGRSSLTDPEARAVLAAYGVPVVEGLTAGSPEAAGQAAMAMGGRITLKILSRDISHKSDVGGVTLNLEPAAVAAAARVMLDRVATARPEATIDGFIIEPMIARPFAQELIVGVSHDTTFGPVVLFGAGGVMAEILADRQVGLPPLNPVLARDMIARTRVSKVLAGYRNRPSAHLDAVVQVLVSLGQLALDLPEVRELDINPLLADAAGVLALDARIGLGPVDTAVRPAIADRAAAPPANERA